jgi:hypothetical protein
MTRLGWGVVAAVAFIMASGAFLHGGDATPVALFVTLPMTDGFADATHALVEVKDAVRQAIAATGDVRLVGRAEDADVILTVLGRGRGDSELNAAVKMLDNDVSASPVAIATTERFVQGMVTVGSCGRSTENDGNRRAPCYKHVFVGLGLDRDAPRPAQKPLAQSAGGRVGPPKNSWEACADALVRDVRAWLSENGARVRALR